MSIFHEIYNNHENIHELAPRTPGSLVTMVIIVYVVSHVAMTTVTSYVTHTVSNCIVLGIPFCNRDLGCNILCSCDAVSSSDGSSGIRGGNHGNTESTVTIESNYRRPDPLPTLTRFLDNCCTENEVNDTLMISPSFKVEF